MLTKDRAEWVRCAEKKQRAVFFYENTVLDLSDFMLHHPGGQQALRNYVYKDITRILFSVYPHNRDKILPILIKYKVGTITEAVNIEKKNDLEKKKRSKTIKRVCFQQILEHSNKNGVTSQDLIMAQNKYSQKIYSKGKEKSNSKKSVSATTMNWKDEEKRIDGKLQRYRSNDDIILSRKKRMEELDEGKGQIILRAIEIKISKDVQNQASSVIDLYHDQS